MLLICGSLVTVLAAATFAKTGAMGAETRVVDLRTEADVKLVSTGSTYVGAGDVNGDGVRDVFAGDCLANDMAGAVYVAFGPFEAGRTDLLEGDFNGFRIDGAESEDGSFPGDRACFPASAGDVNGDGLDDVLVGAPYSGEAGRSSSGTVYVVFGKTSNEAVSLQDFESNTQGLQGYRIDGAARRDYVGQPATVDGVGDINGDGLADIVLGAPFSRSTYVIFGQSHPGPIDLLTFNFDAQGPMGYRIRTPSPSYANDYSVAGAGDVNADGTPDVIVGVIRKLSSPGSSYVVFGKTDSSTVNVKRLDGLGYEIKGPEQRAGLGYSVAGAGDMNDDGRADVVVGAPYAYAYCGPGDAYVIFGKKSSKRVTVSRLGRRGFRIRGAGRPPCASYATHPHVGFSVAGGGDVNGDGVPDVIVGAPYSSRHSRLGSGSVYVIFGKKSTATVDLRELGDQGFRLDGPKKGAHAEASDGSGDFNGDGRSDVLVRVPGSGAAFIVWSHP